MQKFKVSNNNNILCDENGGFKLSFADSLLCEVVPQVFVSIGVEI